MAQRRILLINRNAVKALIAQALADVMLTLIVQTPADAGLRRQHNIGQVRRTSLPDPRPRKIRIIRQRHTTKRTSDSTGRLQIINIENHRLTSLTIKPHVFGRGENRNVVQVRESEF